MLAQSNDYDCIVIGGGPSGSTTAALVADAGYRVLLLERDVEPRRKVGESLMPETYWVFERLGVLDAMKKGPFVQKVGVQFVSSSGRESSPFLFTRHDPRECSRTWHVERAKFDQFLLDNAAKKGVEVRRGVRVLEVIFEGDRAVGVRVGEAAYFFRPDAGTPDEIFAAEVADCPAMAKRLEGAEKVAGLDIVKEYSYATSRASGDGWVLVGDSWGFIDPIYSSGVWFALKSGQLAADAIIEGLRSGNTSGEQLGKWVPDFARGTAWVRKLAEAWYCGQFRVGKFIREYPQHIGPMTDILIGRIFQPEAGRLFDDLDPWLERMKAEGVTS